ncbi:hypothetical protein GCM10009830_39830 [Glycomyces endophyticus]|uniref:DUF3558 domain-containing protein n=1 Tax=Glycomyces endophyticus TaxID=480996 RepID=A0ABP4THG4_9ACTN
MSTLPPPRPSSGQGLKWVVGIVIVAVLALVLTVVLAAVFLSDRLGGLLAGGDADSPSPSAEVPADFDGSLCSDIDTARFEELTGAAVHATTPGDGAAGVDSLHCTYETQDGQTMDLSVQVGDAPDYAATTVADLRGPIGEAGYEVVDIAVAEAEGFAWRLSMEGAGEYGVTVGDGQLVVTASLSSGVAAVEPDTARAVAEEYATLLLEHYAAYV